MNLEPLQHAFYLFGIVAVLLPACLMCGWCNFGRPRSAVHVHNPVLTSDVSRLRKMFAQTFGWPKRAKVAQSTKTGPKIIFWTSKLKYFRSDFGGSSPSADAVFQELLNKKKFSLLAQIVFFLKIPKVAVSKRLKTYLQLWPGITRPVWELRAKVKMIQKALGLTFNLV